MDLAARESSAAWELRGAWASRAVVVLLLDPAYADVTRLAGWVERVSPTGTVAQLDLVDGPAPESWEIAEDGSALISVPCFAVLAVRWPHFHEPLDAAALAARTRPPRPRVEADPEQLSLFDLA